MGLPPPGIAASGAFSKDPSAEEVAQPGLAPRQPETAPSSAGSLMVSPASLAWWNILGAQNHSGRVMAVRYFLKTGFTDNTCSTFVSSENGKSKRLFCLLNERNNKIPTVEKFVQPFIFY